MGSRREHGGLALILRRELEDISGVKGISLRNAEKDYLIDLGLYVISKTGDALCFKGGTMLYKFHNLNRFSEDLDLTTNRRRFDCAGLVDSIIEHCGLIGMAGRVDTYDDHGRAVNAVVAFHGPLYDGSKSSMVRLALNFSSRERPRCTQTRFYTPIYQDLPGFELCTMAPVEMLAEKVRAIMTREKPRDVYDLWFLMQRGVALDTGLVEKKLGAVKKTYSAEVLMEHIMNKKKMWRMDLSGLIMGELPDFNSVVDEILARVEGIDGDVGP
jgi:predicted nucleotidyltransferase component of viral defense system